MDVPFARHEHPDSAAFSPAVLEPPGNTTAADEFAGPADNAEKDNVAPDLAAVQETEVGVEPGKHKVLNRQLLEWANRRSLTYDWQEENGDEIINFLDERDGKSTSVGNNQASEEAAKDGVDT